MTNIISERLKRKLKMEQFQNVEVRFKWNNTRRPTFEYDCLLILSCDETNRIKLTFITGKIHVVFFYFHFNEITNHLFDKF